MVYVINDRTYLLKKNSKLFLACLNEFTKNSFRETSVNEIIKKSELNKGSFYYRFKTKEDIYFALIDYVYTMQITLFNDENIDLLSLNSIEQILYILFENLNKLAILDYRYYILLQRIFKEDIEIQNKVKKNCIEPILVRLNARIKDLMVKNNITVDNKLFFNTLVINYYYFPFDLNDFISSNKLNSVISLILKSLKLKYDSKFNYQGDLIVLPNFYTNLVYLLSKKNKYYFDRNVILLDRYLNNEKEFLSKVRENLKIRKIDLSSIINEGINRNLKDFSYLNVLKNLDFAKESFHLLNQIQKYFLGLVYIIIIGTEKVVIKNILKYSDFKDIHLLFTELLPLLSKTCKIIVIEPELPLFSEVITNLYYQKNDEEIKKITEDLLPYDNSLYYLIKYVNKKGYVITKKISKKDLNIDEFSDKQGFSLVQVKSINIDQIKD